MITFWNNHPKNTWSQNSTGKLLNNFERGRQNPCGSRIDRNAKSFFCMLKYVLFYNILISYFLCKFSETSNRIVFISTIIVSELGKLYETSFFVMDANLVLYYASLSD